MRGAPVWLARLMMYRGLSPKLRIKPEEDLSIRYANALRVASLEGRLSAVWSHPANELAGYSSSTARSAIARAMGLISGTADFLFLADGRCLAQEAKIGRNDLSPNQQDFQRWCDANNVPFRTSRTVEEGLGQLVELGLLISETSRGK